MLNIDSITRGVVIDHIRAGSGMEIYKLLELEELDCPVAIIKNVRGKKQEKKDLIKIEGRIDLDLDALGYIDHNATINIIDDGQIKRKMKLSLPESLRNIVKCRNPRCITSIETDLPHVFRLADKEEKIYRCVYCEQAARQES